MGLKSKLGMAIVASATGTVMVAGGAFALFTAQTSNTGNTFTAGTVKIADYSGGPVAKHAVYFNNLAPGDDGTLVMTVKNTGTLDAWVRIDKALTAASESGDLFGGSTPLRLDLNTQQAVPVLSGQTVQLRIPWVFPRAAENFYQGKHGYFNVVVDAVQYRNNTTSPVFPNAGGTNPGGGDVVDHVATSIQISGDKSFTSPLEGAQPGTLDYSATVLDQSGNPMADQSIIWSVSGVPEGSGISIDPNTGTLTVPFLRGSYFPGGSGGGEGSGGKQPIDLTITATSGSVTNTFAVQIVKPAEEPDE